MDWVNERPLDFYIDVIDWGDGTKSWWMNGIKLDSKLVEIWLKENLVDLGTDEGKMAFKLRWM